MPITDGFSHYVCEVGTCDNDTFAVTGNINASGYVSVKRIDATGVERSITLCGDHAKEYQRLVELCDAAYDAFDQSGEVTLASGAELDKALADLADMTKKRDQWHDKYKALEAEYNALKGGE